MNLKTLAENHSEMYAHLEWVKSNHGLGEQIEIRCIDPTRNNVTSMLHSTIEQAERHALQHVDSKNVYVGVLGRRGARGDANVGERRIVWADIDFGGIGHKNARYATIEDGLKSLEQLPPAQLVVASGGGLHAYWSLTHALEPAEWDCVMLGITTVLQSDKSVRNPERILRLAGTLNHKHNPPVTARILRIDNSTRTDPRLLPQAQAEARKEPNKRDESKLFEVETKLDAVKLIPIENVVEWLGITTHREGNQLRAKCPCHNGDTNNSLLIGGADHKYQARCFGACDELKSTVDLVMGARAATLNQAVEQLYNQFMYDGPQKQASNSNIVRTAVAQLTNQLTNAIDTSWMEQLTRNKQLQCVCNESNIDLIVRNHPFWRGRVKFDTFIREATIDGAKITDRALTDIAIWLQRTPEFLMQNTRERPIKNAVEYAARQLEFNSLTAYVDRLIWDQTNRLHLIAKRAFQIDCPVQAKFLENYVLGMTTRALKPGGKFDNVLCLLGRQGLKKTTFLSVLAGQDRFGYLIDPTSKDGSIGLAGKWVVEVEEGFALKKDPEICKAFFTRQHDDYREPHAIKNTQYPRSCVFGLSTNRQYVTDDTTGARRYWPIWVHDYIDTDWVNEHREQLIAEAAVLVRAGVLPLIENEEMQSRLIVPCPYAQALRDNRAPEITWKEAMKIIGLQSWTMDPVRVEKLQNALESVGYTYDKNECQYVNPRFAAAMPARNRYRWKSETN
jgi:putative DNA primase/helicase